MVAARGLTRSLFTYEVGLSDSHRSTLNAAMSMCHRQSIVSQKNAQSDPAAENIKAKPAGITVKETHPRTPVTDAA